MLFRSDLNDQLAAQNTAAAEGAFRILAVTSCPTGIAHTYMAAEGLEKAARAAGCFIKVETRGSGGAKNVLTDQEIREAASIRNGDPEQLKRAWEEDYTGKLGVLAKTTLRNFQNLGIVLVTLGSRAAMEGGVTPELAYSLSDSYIQKIEEKGKR